MPRLSDTMEEGTILRWIAREGERISRGQELVEIETDKATMVYESDQEGVLQMLAQEGETLAVGAPIARVGDGGAPSVQHETARSDDGPASGGPASVTVDGAQPAAAAAAAGATPADAEHDVQTGERVRASPLARRLARERGVELRELRGSGPGGRIVKADVESARVPAAPAVDSSDPGPANGRTGTPVLAGLGIFLLAGLGVIARRNRRRTGVLR